MIDRALIPNFLSGLAEPDVYDVSAEPINSNSGLDLTAFNFFLSWGDYSSIFHKERDLEKQASDLYRQGVDAANRYDLIKLKACDEALSQLQREKHRRYKERFQGLLKRTPAAINELTNDEVLMLHTEFMWGPHDMIQRCERTDPDKVPGLKVVKLKMLEISGQMANQLGCDPSRPTPPIERELEDILREDITKQWPLYLEAKAIFEGKLPEENPAASET